MDISERVYAFIDEFGTTTLSPKDNSHLYICVAVVIPENKIDDSRRKLESIKNNEFNVNGVMKSVNIGTDNVRRARVLEKLTEIEFKYYALITNKSNLDPNSGMRWKGSAYKRISRILYSQLSTEYNHIFVVKDNYGRREFRDSFNDYLKKHNLCSNLFNSFEHNFIDSKNEIFVQMADLVAGMLAYIYDEKRKSEYSSRYQELLAPHKSYLSVWPLRFTKSDRSSPENTVEIDEYLNYILTETAFSFVNQYDGGTKEEFLMPAAALRILLSREQYSGNQEYMDTSVLAEKLRKEGFCITPNENTKVKRYIGHNITAILRDNGIIITGTDNGIKVASSLADIHNYVRRNASQIEPRLMRLQIAREVVRKRCNNYDFLDREEFATIKRITDSFTASRDDILLKNNYEVEEE
jgi:hypothetical protein